MQHGPPKRDALWKIRKHVYIDYEKSYDYAELICAFCGGVSYNRNDYISESYHSFWSGWGRIESDIQSCCGMERILIIHGSMMVRLFLPAEPLFVIGVMAENGRYPWSDWGRDDGGALIMDMFYWDIRGKSRSRCDICVRNIHRNLRALCAAA